MAGQKQVNTSSNPLNVYQDVNGNYSLQVVSVDANGNPVSGASGSGMTLLAGENHIGEVGGRTKVTNTSVTRPANTTAYAAGQVVASAGGSSIFTFSGAARINAGSGVIIGVSLLDEANQTTKADFDLFLFSTSPTSQADQVALGTTNSDMEACIGRVQFLAGNAVIANAGAGAAGQTFYPSSLTNNIAFQAAAGSTTIYGILVARSAYTPVSAEKLFISLRILQD